MRFKAHAVMHGSPELKLRLRSEPIHFELGASGGLKVALGPVRIKVEEVPITLAIPFLRRRAQAVASIGPFGVRVESVDAEARSVDVRLTGVLGKDSVTCELDGKIGCRTEFDVVGQLPGKVARASIQLVDAERYDDDDDDDEERKDS